jgi:hypothetical protein
MFVDGKTVAIVSVQSVVGPEPHESPAVVENVKHTVSRQPLLSGEVFKGKVLRLCISRGLDEERHGKGKEGSGPCWILYGHGEHVQGCSQAKQPTLNGPYHESSISRHDDFAAVGTEPIVGWDNAAETLAGLPSSMPGLQAFLSGEDRRASRLSSQGVVEEGSTAGKQQRGPGQRLDGWGSHLATMSVPGI